jgi:ABC-2 type transport system ATP-binding protein
MSSAIEIRDLHVSFRSRRRTISVLDGVSLTVPAGTVLGFIGPNGAGKTTTMHVLLGFIRPTSGEARIFGTDVQQSIARQRIGYLPENPDTYRFLTGRELLEIAGNLFHITGAALKRRVDEVLDEVGLRDAAQRRVGSYSRGMLQRIGLAQALINDPDLIILDEPTSGLDPVGRLAIRQTIGRMRDRGKTVFFSSHEMSEVELVCDSVAMLLDGKVIAEGPASRLVPSGCSLEQYFMQTMGASAREKGL